VTVKDILVHVDLFPAATHRTEAAISVARRFGAQVTGLFVKPRPIAKGYAFSEFGAFLDDGAFRTVDEETDQQLEKAAADLKSVFIRQLRNGGVLGAYSSVVGSLADQVIAQARYADLAIVGQSDPEGQWVLNVTSIGQVLVGAGRPVLVLPYSGRFPSIGERVLIAWKASREATRAVNDALPFLRSAKHVRVLSVALESASASAGADTAGAIISHLARHGVSAELHVDSAEDMSVGRLVLAHASLISADLIVAGAYGHSRVRELVFGGVTRTLLASTTIPLLMSH
jgi:nucleotide-binding universal stress UspA family protein